MQGFILVLCCCLVLFSQTVRAQSPAGSTPKHGGKIESKYDGFNYETLMQLRKMKVSCDGIRDTFKDDCVSIEVTLHLPGMQLNYVRSVTLQIIFENQDWVRIHPPEQRNLSITTDTETIRLGRMELVTNKKPGTWDTKIETLRATIPYDVFKKVVRSESVGIQVGNDAVMLREKNIAALRDLNNRVLTPPASCTTGTAETTLSRSPGK